MNIEFSPNEARVIGCLLEKEITTPDQYPLSLNALTNACNQKTNRDPVLELSEAVVQQTVDALMKKYLVSDKSAGYGGRVTKYKHRFCNTEFGSLKFSKQELGIICVLLLRGAQTPGELRGRTNRLCDFADAAEVEATLENLMTREDGPFIARMPRAAGARESRYAHLFSGIIESVEEPGAVEESTGTATLNQRVTQLEGSGGAALARAEIDVLKWRRGLGTCLTWESRPSAWRCRRAPLQPLAERVDVGGAHAAGRRAMAVQPLLHGLHQLIRQRAVMVEQIHVRGLCILQTVDRHISLAAMFDGLEELRLELERMVVVIDQIH